MIIYRFFKYLIQFIQYNKALSKVYREENIVENLSRTLETTFKVDWVNRLYTIFNPNLKNGVFDRSNPIYSYNEQGLNTDEFVRQYIMTKLSAADHYINATNLFELGTYELKKLDNYDNYLFIIKPLPLDNFLKYSKLMIIPIVLIITTIALLIAFL